MDEHTLIDRELKKGSTEMLILALVEDRPRHGYEMGKLIGQRSRGVLHFHVASLYPTLYHLEAKGWLKAAWESKEGGRRRRTYRITPAGRKVLTARRKNWRSYMDAIARVARIRHA